MHWIGGNTRLVSVFNEFAPFANDDIHLLHVSSLFDFNRNSQSFFAKWALSGSSKLIPVELTTSAILLSNLSSENRYMKKSKP